MKTETEKSCVLDAVDCCKVLVLSHFLSLFPLPLPLSLIITANIRVRVLSLTVLSCTTFVDSFFRFDRRFILYSITYPSFTSGEQISLSTWFPSPPSSPPASSQRPPWRSSTRQPKPMLQFTGVKDPVNSACSNTANVPQSTSSTLVSSTNSREKISRAMNSPAQTSVNSLHPSQQHS